MSELKRLGSVRDAVEQLRDLLVEIDQLLGLNSLYAIRCGLAESDWHGRFADCLPRVIGWLEQERSYEEASHFQARLRAISEDPLLNGDDSVSLMDHLSPAPLLEPSRPVRDWEKAIGLTVRVQKALGACESWLLQLGEAHQSDNSEENRVPSGGNENEPPGVSDAVPLMPRNVLIGWDAILAELGKEKDARVVSSVKNLNKVRNGPILSDGRGHQPRVDRADLIKWWNGLAEQNQERVDRERDAQETVRETYLHGRSGEVVPEISGEVKKRRKTSTNINKVP